MPKTSSDETSCDDNDDSEDNNNNNDNDDSEGNQISNFVDEVLKKVSKEVVNDNAKKIKSKVNITERIKKMEGSENLFHKQFRDAKRF